MWFYYHKSIRVSTRMIQISCSGSMWGHVPIPPVIPEIWGHLAAWCRQAQASTKPTGPGSLDLDIIRTSGLGAY